MAAKTLKARTSLAEFEAFKPNDVVQTNESVLEQKINWNVYAQSNQLTQQQVAQISEYAEAQDKNRLLQENGAVLAQSFLDGVANIASPEALQYLLALVDSLLTDDETRVAYFYQRAGNRHPAQPLLHVLSLNPPDVFTRSKAALIAGRLLAVSQVNADSPQLAEFFQTLSQYVLKSDLAAVVSIKTALKNPAAQVVFARSGGIKSLAGILRKETQNTQLLYYIVFSFWLTSYNREVREELLQHEIIYKVIEVLKAAPRKKVVRVAFAMLKNLLEIPSFCEIMIAGGLPKILPSLSAKKWADDDLAQDIIVVDETLQKFVITLSSFEKYHAELLSGHLEWSPVHNERFFRENMDKFTADNYASIRTLIGLLDSEDQLTLEVACYDLGEFARFHPDGKKVLGKLGGKGKLMQLMSHPVPKVAKQALLTVQKLMVNNWESLTTASSANPSRSAVDI